MFLKRRHFLATATALGAAALLPRSARSNTLRPRRVVIVGGGWGGLAAARYLREFAPDIDVTLLEKNAFFWSCPLSNKWLVGLIDDTLLSHDYHAAARTWNYRFVQTEVSIIERDARRVITRAGPFDYDWLVMAVGIRHDYTAWFGDDLETANYTSRHYPSAYTPGTEFQILRDKLAHFKGGDLLMTVPPQPFRCPPAPYERAALIAGWLEARKIPARLIIIDPNPPFQEFQRIFHERFPQRIDYRAQTAVLTVDPHQRTVKTEFETFSFDDAILMPPQQAGTLAWQADLIGQQANKQPSGWAAVDPLSFAAVADPRIFMIGDMIDRVSPLFGHYPKSGQMASRQGRIVAQQIAAQAHGTTAPRALPDSLCHIATQYDPPEAIRIASNYRIRGDGEIMPQTKVERDPQPRGEDIAWAQGMFGEFLAPSSGLR
jgi:NADPH-dependent 2,4-dienoyl-CoA reductase/sulfur reductase-like enzyme